MGAVEIVGKTGLSERFIFENNSFFQFSPSAGWVQSMKGARETFRILSHASL